jgi:hypothetical protein
MKAPPQSLPTRLREGVEIESASLVSRNNHAGNRLLAVLSPADRELVRPDLELVPLEVRQILERPGEPISHAHFVESGLVSMIGVSQADQRIEVGMVGYEGVAGVGVVLGCGAFDQ